MADHTNNQNPHPQATQLPERLSDAARVRAVADAELGADSGEIGRGVAFEQNLRSAVGRVMSDPQSAPAGLREKILARFDEEVARQPISFREHASEAKPLSGRRLGGFSSLLPRFAAVAAVLLLGGAVIFLGAQQFGPGGNQLTTTNGLSVQTVSSQLQFVQREHNRCSDIASGNFTSKIVATDPAEARSFAESRLGCGGARLADAISRMTDSGYRFIGVGACAVPGGGKSVHALFTPADASSQLHPVSVFLLESPGEGCRNVDPSVCYSCPKAREAGKPSMLWRDNDLIVFVHSDSEQSVDIARNAYLAPDAVQSL